MLKLMDIKKEGNLLTINFLYIINFYIRLNINGFGYSLNRKNHS